MRCCYSPKVEEAINRLVDEMVIEALHRRMRVNALDLQSSTVSKPKPATATKRHMSPEARARIAAATRKRWAEYRKQKAKAA